MLYGTRMALGTLRILLTAQLRRGDGSRSIASLRNEKLFGQQSTGSVTLARSGINSSTLTLT